MTIQLGSRLEYVNGKLVDYKENFQYIPIMEGLTALCKNQEIYDEVCNSVDFIVTKIIFQILASHARSDGFISDYCDGSAIKSHELFINHPDALQLIIYFDVCNPLGAQRGIHKLGENLNTACTSALLLCIIIGMFYYMIGNMRPELRSTHRAIQLFACVTNVNLVKYGFRPVLKPFIEDVNKLSEVSIT